MLKEELLKGSKYIYKMKLGENEIEIRDLTEGEWLEVDRIRQKPLSKVIVETQNGQIVEKITENTPLLEFTEAERDAKYLAVAYALSVNERWSTDEVKLLGRKTVESIYEFLIEKSGVEMKELPFRL